MAKLSPPTIANPLLNTPRFSGPGSTAARRAFWDSLHAEVRAVQKVEGANVDIDVYPGGSVINAARVSCACASQIFVSDQFVPPVNPDEITPIFPGTYDFIASAALCFQIFNFFVDPGFPSHVTVTIDGSPIIFDGEASATVFVTSDRSTYLCNRKISNAGTLRIVLTENAMNIQIVGCLI